MGGATNILFHSGERPVEELKNDVLDQIDRVEEEHVAVVSGSQLVVGVSSGNFGLPVETPCDWALVFWQNDTSLSGGGTLYEWDGQGFSRVDETSDEQYGRQSYDYFRSEYGIEAIPPKRSFD